MNKIKSYIVTFLPPRVSKKYTHYECIFATNKKEVDIVVNMLYPRIVNSVRWNIGTGFIKSEILEREGKVSYIY